MSRCYPFPPPGYAGKCSSHEALILSIKLQKEKEKALSAQEGEKAFPDREKEKLKTSERKDTEHRKDKKRDREDRKKEKKDRKDRRKEKKEKRAEKKGKFTAPVDTGKQNVVDEFSKVDNVLPESKGKLLGSSCELLERSIVTEEHGQPIESHNMPCSSDSTGNSGKRKKSSSSPSDMQSSGKVIRIRLSTSKKDEASTSGSKLQEAGPRQQTREDLEKSYSQVHPCATHVKSESSIKQQEGFPCVASASCATLQPVSTDVSRLKEKTTKSVSQNEKLTSHERIQIREEPAEKMSSKERRKQKKEAVYQNLFVDWVPPPSLEGIILMDENDDEDWLFGKKNEVKSAERLRGSGDVRSCVDSNIRCTKSAVMQPRACFLADAEICALPFTVPF